MVYIPMPMQPITQSYTDFFKELAANNHKEWFQANKKRYDKDVREPFIHLLEGLVAEIQKWQPDISTDVKQSLFRINRDIRFSKDKTPYNTVMKSNLSAGGRKSPLPGNYIGIDAESVHIGGGLYNLDPKQVKKVRSHISNNLGEWKKLTDSKDFKKYLGEIKGEKAKRVDSDIKDLAEENPILYYKQFYYMAERPISELLNAKDQVAYLSNFCKAAAPLNAFLTKAIQ